MPVLAAIVDGTQEVKRWYVIAYTVFLVLLLQLFLAGTAQGLETTLVTVDDGFEVEVAKGEFLVRFTPGTSPATRQAILSTMNLQELLFRRDADYAKAAMLENDPSGQDMENRFDQLIAHPRITHVEYNAIMRVPDLFQHPASFSPAFDPPVVTPGAPRVVIAVLDTGIAYTDYFDGTTQYLQAPDLEGVPFVQGHDLINGDNMALDDHGHGTHVAGALVQALAEFQGIEGTEIDYAIMPVKVFDQDGEGTVDSIAGGIYVDQDNPASVIYIGGGFPPEVPYGTFLEQSLNEAAETGMTIIAPAGDEMFPIVSLPAAFPSVMAVASVVSSDQRAPYSSFGPELEVCAFGGDSRDLDRDGIPDGIIQSTLYRGAPSHFENLASYGTAHAAIRVTALAALIKASGEYPPADIRLIITDTADHPDGPGAWDIDFGYGVINPEGALGQVQGF